MSDNFTEAEEVLLKQAYDLFDYESNENLNPKELISAMVNWGYALKYPFLFNIILNLDQENMTSGIDFDQFKMALLFAMGDRQSKENIEKLFDLIDIRKSGRINFFDLKSLTEISEVKSSEEEIKTILKELSSDRKEITKEDFVRVITEIYKLES